MTTKTLDPLEEIKIHGITSGEHTKGWVHTHGMRAHGKPELEMIVSPLFMIPFAFDLLNNVADYLLNSGKTVRVGELMRMEHHVFRLVEATPIQGEEEHYQEPVFRLVDVEPEAHRVPRTEVH